MIPRQFWIKNIESALNRKNILWLAGVRRAGKTVLAQSLPKIEYFDCELPRVRSDLDDPEIFLESIRGKRIVLDEIHRLHDPSSILKIAADHFSDVQIIATGSSTLGASAKFQDTLTGRKTSLWLTPMITQDMSDFSNDDWGHRFLHGGLPPFFLADTLPETEIQEWMDSYWAKDIQELFRLERRSSFLRFTELLLLQSGGMFEATRFAGPCEVSRPTIMNYLSVMEATYLVHVVRPFSSRRSTEIISMPKVYGFDTGFVCATKGLQTLHEKEKGLLWEHIVLNELHAHLQTQSILYWRDKRGHEIDFVLRKKGDNAPIGIECKWGKEEYNEQPIRSFLHHYPDASIYIVKPHQKRKKLQKIDDKTISIVDIKTLIKEIEK